MKRCNDLKNAWAPKLVIGLTLSETILHLSLDDWPAATIVVIETFAERVGIPWKLRCAILIICGIVIMIATIEKARHGASFLELLVPIFSLAKSILNMLRH